MRRGHSIHPIESVQTISKIPLKHFGKREGRTEGKLAALRERGPMAEYGEWNRKSVTLSDVTAKAEYGVDLDFVIKGIQTGKLEYRHGSVWGNIILEFKKSA